MIASEETFLLLVVSNNNSLLTTHLPPVNLTGNTYKDMPIYGFSVNKLYNALNILASFKYLFPESKPVRFKLISQDHISHHGAYCQKT